MFCIVLWFVQSVRDARHNSDSVGVRAAAAEQRAVDALEGLQKVTERMNRTEPRVDDFLKELAFSVEGSFSLSC
jgi:hypothetical protein